MPQATTIQHMILRYQLIHQYRLQTCCGCHPFFDAVCCASCCQSCSLCQIQREMKSLRERGVGKTIKEMHSTGDIYLFEPQIKNAMDKDNSTSPTISRARC